VGIEEYKKIWDLFFACNKTSQAFDIEELEITAGEDVAFAVAVIRRSRIASRSASCSESKVE
jgi:ketosteroid isomerase-like protein